jgi:hypothetical protein
MNIDPALDKWVWILALVLLVLLGTRAWVVETGRRQFGGTPSRVRALTVASGVVLVALSTLFMTQAGALLVRAVVTRTDPLSQLGGADNGPDPNGLQAPAGQQQAGQQVGQQGGQPAGGAAPAAPGR